MSGYDRRGTQGALFVTACVFGALFAAMGVTAWNKDTQSFGGLIETVKSLTMVAGGYWLGSSVSSARKDQTISDATQALAVSSPPNQDR
jgi:hypothetical protein